MADINPDLTLSNGQKIPRVGLGTGRWSLAFELSPEEKTRVQEGVKAALKLGYRHIDTAPIYGSEEPVGCAIKECIAEGIINREDVFVTTKLWSTCHRKELVEPALRGSLQRLGLDYVDLYLLFWPAAFQPSSDMFPTDTSGNLLFDNDVADNVATWQEIERWQQKGLARSIGISNFNIRQTQRILDNCSIKPVINQIECHPYNPNEKMVQFCKANGIAVTCWAPLCYICKREENDPDIHTDPVIGEIAKRHDRTPVQVALRYQLQRGLTVIPGSLSPAHQAENLKRLDFALSEEDMGKIANISQRFYLGRKFISKGFLGSKEYPYEEGSDLM